MRIVLKIDYVIPEISPFYLTAVTDMFTNPCRDPS